MTQRFAGRAAVRIAVFACIGCATAACAVQQPLPRNQQPVLATPPVGRPNLDPVLAPGVIQEDIVGRAPESLNSLPRGSEVAAPLTPQAGQINSVRVGPSPRP